MQLSVRITRSLVVAVLVAVTAGCSPGPTPGTPTTAGRAAVGFVAVGDAGSGDAVQASVAGAMGTWAATHRVDALVTAGDNVYTDGNPALYATRLDGPYRELLDGRPMWAALGNHDVAGGWGDTQMAHLGLPGRYYEQVLSRDGVQLQLLVLDSNAELATQAAWLDTKLSEPGYRWRVVVFHYPVWSCSEHGSTAEVDAAWRGVVQRHGNVDVVLQGHDHLYQRFDVDGTQWVVTGGGGMPLYAARPCAPGTPPLTAVAVRHHFVAVEATPTSLVLTAVARDGTVLDRTELR